MRKATPADTRFWAKVDIQGPDGCWLWLATKTSGGYGVFRVNTNKRTTAHRFAYELTFGQIPDDTHIMHLCHVVSCCNPKHLVVGTPQENVLHKITSNRLQVNSPQDMIGIRWREDRNVWQAQGTINGVSKSLYFGPSQEDAITARKIWEESICKKHLSFLQTNLGA